MDRGGEGEDLGGNHRVFLGGTDGRSVVANRVQKVDYRGDHQNTTKPQGRTNPPIPPPPFLPTAINKSGPKISIIRGKIQ